MGLGLEGLRRHPSRLSSPSRSPTSAVRLRGGRTRRKLSSTCCETLKRSGPSSGPRSSMAMRARSTVSCRCCSTACSDVPMHSADPMEPMVSEAEPPGAKTKFIHVANPCSRRIDCALRASFGTSAAASLLRRDRWLDGGGCGVTCGLCGFSARPATFVRVSRAARRFGVSIEARIHAASDGEDGIRRTRFVLLSTAFCAAEESEGGAIIRPEPPAERA